jgi:hypothetical protein
MITLQHLLMFLSGVIVPITVALINKKLEARKLIKSDKLEQEIKISVIVNNKLEHLKDEYGADRVWVTQFHNGGNYYPSNKSIQKFSMFYEICDMNADPIRTLFQNIPISLFSPSATAILEHNVIAISDFKDPFTSTYGLKYTAEETGTKSIYIFGIRDIHNRLIGTLGLDYVKRKKALDNTDIQMLEIEAAQIGGVLHKHLYEK